VSGRKRRHRTAGWQTGIARRLALVCLFGASWGWTLRAQENPAAPDNAAPTADPAALPPDNSLTTMFEHAEWDRLWLSGQANFISQWHPAFDSPYQGKNSLTPEAQDASSRVLTLYTGWRATNTTEFLCDVQETGGHGSAKPWARRASSTWMWCAIRC